MKLFRCRLYFGVSTIKNVAALALWTLLSTVALYALLAALTTIAFQSPLAAYTSRSSASSLAFLTLSLRAALATMSALTGRAGYGRVRTALASVALVTLRPLREDEELIDGHNFAVRSGDIYLSAIATVECRVRRRGLR